MPLSLARSSRRPTSSRAIVAYNCHSKRHGWLRSCPHASAHVFVSTPILIVKVSPLADHKTGEQQWKPAKPEGQQHIGEPPRHRKSIELHIVGLPTCASHGRPGRAPPPTSLLGTALSSSCPAAAVCEVGRHRWHATHRPLDAVPPQPAGTTAPLRATMLTHGMCAVLHAAPAATQRCGHIPADPSWSAARAFALHAYLSRAAAGPSDPGGTQDHDRNSNYNNWFACRGYPPIERQRAYRRDKDTRTHTHTQPPRCVMHAARLMTTRRTFSANNGCASGLVSSHILPRLKMGPALPRSECAGLQSQPPTKLCPPCLRDLS